MGRDSVIGIATRYGLDGPGIESRRGEILRACSDRPWGPPSLLYNGYLVFPGGKAAGVWRWPTPSIAEVKERVELHLYFPSGPSWPVLGWTVPLLCDMMISDRRIRRDVEVGSNWDNSTKNIKSPVCRSVFELSDYDAGVLIIWPRYSATTINIFIFIVNT
jgi:hypothetical protein